VASQEPAEEQPYRGLVRFGLLVLLVAVVVDIAVELHRALAELQSWICGTTPTPGGPAACGAAFVARWITTRLPLYVVGVGAVALLASAVAAFRPRERAASGGPWARLLRVVTVVICLIALAELVACAGDATCGLSVSCT
jgi:hypothetical protein